MNMLHARKTDELENQTETKLANALNANNKKPLLENSCMKLI